MLQKLLKKVQSDQDCPSHLKTVPTSRRDSAHGTNERFFAMEYYLVRQNVKYFKNTDFSNTVIPQARMSCSRFYIALPTEAKADT